MIDCALPSGIENGSDEQDQDCPQVGKTPGCHVPPASPFVSGGWAQRLDREFRSTLTNSPHGRVDIAKALARHLAAFDALHDIPKVAESGLLPPRIGAIR